MKILATALCGALVLGMTSCGGVTGGKKKGRKITETNPTLMGTWKSACIGEDFLDLSHTVKEVKFNPVGDFERTEMFYLGDDCSKPLLSYETRGSAADLDTNTDKKTRSLNLTVNEQYFTPHNDTLASALNKVKFCDKDDWQAGEKARVDGHNCGGQTVADGAVIFDIYRKEDKQMFFGKTSLLNSKDSADDRPSELDHERAFAKQ